ncbi:MAG TPA: 6-phosphofructokinase, partial [Candidatus Acidoferrales bacterium]|nr:6-phosphofructokinase [Candidatus Acidoferrales bacterium]
YVTSARCVIPEYPFDLDLLVRLLVEDKRGNPSNYSFVIASEGAVWTGYKAEDFGEADAYGHRKKVDIGHALAEVLRQRTGEETMTSDLTYDLRSGDPDAVDQVVATTFANLALDLFAGNTFGKMVAVREGRYAHTPLPDPALGPRTVDVEKLYNTQRYRPRYAGKLGDPLFLISA